ncbi:hypothetical protein SAMN06264941_0803 [Methanohalophilus portucalensis FDF-1]|uniref:Uncharacterized protein n=2 Tax=Methanohalophilus portucalensis FDF-1 TaxID=523843 RepID=A0A1X7N935_9EURY|nr:hypothetical protein SAMN06264941_0803 [Methanohalophilus portucalensis FDF-1]
MPKASFTNNLFANGIYVQIRYSSMSNVDFIKLSEKGYRVWIKGNHCYRCDYEWTSSFPREPNVCPKCKSPYWSKPRKNERIFVQKKVELETKAIKMHELFDQVAESKYDTVVPIIREIDEELSDSIQDYHDTKIKQRNEEQANRKSNKLSKSEIEEITQEVIENKETLKTDDEMIKKVMEIVLGKY